MNGGGKLQEGLALPGQAITVLGEERLPFGSVGVRNCKRVTHQAVRSGFWNPATLTRSGGREPRTMNRGRLAAFVLIDRLQLEDRVLDHFPHIRVRLLVTPGMKIRKKFGQLEFDDDVGGFDAHVR